jgi:hypothetical protein
MRAFGMNDSEKPECLKLVFFFLFSNSKAFLQRKGFCFVMHQKTSFNGDVVSSCKIKNNVGIQA